MEKELVKGSRILIVDDEENFSRVLGEVLADDHDVIVVTSSSEALSLVQNGERYNAIVCDILMPKISGDELYRQINQIDPEQATRMVFMSGENYSHTDKSFLDATKNRRLEKPFQLKELRKLINTLIFK